MEKNVKKIGNPLHEIFVCSGCGASVTDVLDYAEPLQRRLNRVLKLMKLLEGAMREYAEQVVKIK